MSNKTKIEQPKEEQLKQQQIRSLLQQRASVAQGVLYNILQAEGMKKEPAEVADYAVAVSEEFMRRLYQ